MMATVPHVTSGLGLRKFQAHGFLLTRVYKKLTVNGFKRPYKARRLTAKTNIVLFGEHK